MSQNMPYIHPTTVEMDRCDQPVLVATDVEHNPIIYFVRRWKGLSQVIETSELSAFHNLKPANQRSFAVRMLLPKVA